MKITKMFVRLFVRRHGTFCTDIDSWIRRVNQFCSVFEVVYVCCSVVHFISIQFSFGTFLFSSFTTVTLHLSWRFFYKHPDLLKFNLLNGINKLHRRKKNSKQLTKNTCVFTMNSLQLRINDQMKPPINSLFI